MTSESQARRVSAIVALVAVVPGDRVDRPRLRELAEHREQESQREPP